jgi:hypothetical protein
MDIGTDFLLLSIIFIAIRLYYYKEKSVQLLLMELASGIFMAFAIYFLLVPYYSFASTTTIMANVPLYCTTVSVTCPTTTEVITTNTLSQLRPNLYPQMYVGFLAEIIYAVIIIFWTIKDVTSLFGKKLEEDDSFDILN